MSGAPILLPARHLLNLAIGAAIVALVVILVMSGGSAIWAWKPSVKSPSSFIAPSTATDVTAAAQR